MDKLGKMNAEINAENEQLKEKVQEFEHNQLFEIGELKKSRSSKTEFDLDQRAIDEDQLRAFLNVNSWVNTGSYFHSVLGIFDT